MSTSARISVIYFIAGSLWIGISDQVVELVLRQNPEVATLAQMFKGWLFIALTGVVLYLVLKHEFDARYPSGQKAIDRESRFHALFVSNPLPMWIYDRDTLAFMDVNEAACAHYGYQRDEFLATHVNEVHVPEDLPQLMNYLSQARPGYHFSSEFHHLTRDKHIIEVNTSANVLDFSGREAVLVAIQDMTEYKRAELERVKNEELRLMLAQEAELNLMRSRFTSMISHEFRRPLTTITASIELLEHYRDRMTDKVAQKHFERIHEQLGEVQELLDDFLALMRLETVEQVFRPTSVSLSELCRKLTANTKLSAKTGQVIRYTSGSGNVVISGDEKLLRHAVGNLLSNAVKYSPMGAEIRLELIRNQNIEIRVSDQGIGIPAEEQTHVFDPFYRASNVGEADGTGLGLAIAKKAIEAHRGTLEISKSDMTGTEFIIKLPVNEPVSLTGC